MVNDTHDARVHVIFSLNVDGIITCRSTLRGSRFAMYSEFTFLQIYLFHC